DLADRLVGELDQRLVEQDRLDLPDSLPVDLEVLLARDSLRRPLRLVEHRRERRRVEVTLVEQAFRRLDDRRDDPRLRHDAADRADGAAADASRDLADLELELRRPRERVAALVHRRRARVRSLTAEGDAVALDAERAEDDTERELERLEHGALLDVQLEVGARAGELRAGVERTVEVDAVLPQRVLPADAVRVLPLADLVLVAHRPRSRRGAEQRAAEARPLLVGPVDEPHGHRRLAVGGDPAQDLDAGDDVERAVEPAPVRDRVDVPPDQEGAVGAAWKREPLVSGR